MRSSIYFFIAKDNIVVIIKNALSLQIKYIMYIKFSDFIILIIVVLCDYNKTILTSYYCFFIFKIIQNRQ
jgi:hypothetical protein